MPWSVRAKRSQFSYKDVMNTKPLEFLTLPSIYHKYLAHGVNVLFYASFLNGISLDHKDFCTYLVRNVLGIVHIT